MADTAPQGRHAHIAGAETLSIKEKEDHSDTSSHRGAETYRSENINDLSHEKGLPNDEKIEITEEECYDELGYSFPSWKKWTILTVIFWIQVSMNFNTSLYSNALTGISEEFHVSAQAARVGAMIFLVAYAFGCELWAPWSEEVSDSNQNMYIMPY
jgi:hypothetical protein